jgi:hypothetical protein
MPMPAGAHKRQAPAAADYERAAERLLDVLLAVWEPGAGFAQQLRSLLGATLDLFAAEPELCYTIAVWPFAGEQEVVSCYQRWQQRYGDLLRAAAAQSPAARAHPPFLEPALIAGIHWQISRRMLAEGPAGLPGLLPSLMEFVLVCYFDPHDQGAALASSTPCE